MILNSEQKILFKIFSTQFKTVKKIKKNFFNLFHIKKKNLNIKKNKTYFQSRKKSENNLNYISDQKYVFNIVLN